MGWRFYYRVASLKIWTENLTENREGIIILVQRVSEVSKSFREFSGFWGRFARNPGFAEILYFVLEILLKIGTENRTENGWAIFSEGRFAQNLD